MSFKKIPLYTRILIIFTLCIAGLSLVVMLFLISVYSIDYKRNLNVLHSSLLNEQKIVIKERIDQLANSLEYKSYDLLQSTQDALNRKLQTRYQQLDLLYRKNGSENRNKVIELFKKELDSDSSLVYAISYEGEALIFPDNRDLEGQTIINRKDDNSREVIKEELAAVQKDREAYLFSYWRRSKDSSASLDRRISYVMRVDSLDMYIAIYDWYSIKLPGIVKDLNSRIAYDFLNSKHQHYAINFDGQVVAHYNNKTVGKNLSDLKDRNDLYITQEILKARSSNQGVFVEYHPQMAGNKDSSMLAYAFSLNEHGVVLVGEIELNQLAVTLKEREKVLQRDFLIRLVVLIIIICLAVATSMYALHTLYVKFHHESNLLMPLLKGDTTTNIADASLFSIKEFALCVSLIHRYKQDIVDLQKRERQLIRIDRLTGFQTPDALQEILSREMKFFNKFKTPLSLVYIVIDNFNELIEELKEENLSQIVYECSEIIKADLSEVEICARWKRSEFLLIVPRLTRFQAKQRAEKIRRAVESFSFSHTENLHVSIGVVSCRREDDQQLLIERSIRAAERAVGNGQNRVEMV